MAARVLEQLDPGTSMGGARPKAPIEDGQSLWLWRDCFFSCGVSAKDIDYIAPAMLPACFFLERPSDA